MQKLLEFFIIIPATGFLISLAIPSKKEAWLSRIAFGTAGLQLILAMAFVIYWVINGHKVLNQPDISVFKTHSYDFLIDFIFDRITAVYLIVGSVLTFLVTLYSRYYLHREAGYKRFFNTTLFFYLGYNLAIFSGNLETLFIGWEILGITSFLLIAFYRDRYLPVKNAVKVFSIYRVADVGLILAMWASHHLWHENILFIKMADYELVNDKLASHTFVGVFISLMILLSAAAKSAQLPFSSWLPRAMEGPTPSSAIFYGSMSVHMGIFLMLRTFPFWEHQLSVRILIGIMGLTTSLVAASIARVQSSVKSQIAYSSIAQIGLMFIELAFGLKDLALYHFAGNAFLRTYQLLVSPSVVTYHIREQFYKFIPRKQSIEDSFPKKIEYTLYMLSLKEWNLDSILYRYLWNPLKMIGRKLDVLSERAAMMVLGIIYIGGCVDLYFQDEIPVFWHRFLPTIFSVIGLLMILKAFTERKKVRMSWISIIMNHFWIALALSYNELFSYVDTLLYLSGIIVAGLVGFVVLNRLRKLEQNIDLDRFQGHSFMHPKLALVFLLACLGLTGFPITPTFIGEDLIFTHIHENQYILAAIISLSFVIDGIAVIRIYARVFLGPHVRSVYEMAYRSS